MSKVPPYGKELSLLQAKGLKPSGFITVFIGTNAWELGRFHDLDFPNRTLILPPWLSPSDYFWPVKGCKVVILDSGYAEEDYVEELAINLFRHGAIMSVYSCIDGHVAIFKKDV